MHGRPNRPDGTGNNDDKELDDDSSNEQDLHTDDDTVLVATLALESELWPEEDGPDITQELETLEE